MKSFPDLSSYCWEPFTNSENTWNIGWLSPAAPFTQGAVPSIFFDRLWTYCHYPIAIFRGIYSCPFCTKSIREEKFIVVSLGTDTLVLGTSQIRVFGKEGRIYAAPDLIYHFVRDHSYRPPEEFILAVLDVPHPDSSEYLERLNQIGFSPAEPLRELRFIE